MKVRETVCGECPFRRGSAAGWLGANDPEAFAAAALAEQSVACHTMVNQTLQRPKWEQAEAEAPRCRGALTFQRNICKLPRDPEMRDLVNSVPADRENVFSTPKEFIEHHQSSPVRSWEF